MAEKLVFSRQKQEYLASTMALCAVQREYGEDQIGRFEH